MHMGRYSVVPHPIGSRCHISIKHKHFPIFLPLLINMKMHCSVMLALHSSINISICLWFAWGIFSTESLLAFTNLFACLTLVQESSNPYYIITCLCDTYHDAKFCSLLVMLNNFCSLLFVICCNDYKLNV